MSDKLKIVPPIDEVKDSNTDEYTEEELSVFDEIFNLFNDKEEQIGPLGMEELGALMSLPDEHFNQLSELFLLELEKGLNNPTDKIALQKAMMESGQTPETLATLQEEVIKEIDEKMSEDLPQSRLDFLKRMMIIMTNIFNDTYGAAKAVVSIPLELCHPDAKVPKYARLGDGAVDIYALEDVEILPGETKILKTGLKTAIPMGYALLIQPRSGQSVKTKLRVANTPGLIDSGYRDEIGVIVENIEPKITDIEYEFEGTQPVIKSIEHGRPFIIEKGQRFAQMRLVEVPTANFILVDSVKDIGIDRGSGFGNTGNK